MLQCLQLLLSAVIAIRRLSTWQTAPSRGWTSSFYQYRHQKITHFVYLTYCASSDYFEVSFLAHKRSDVCYDKRSHYFCLCDRALLSYEAFKHVIPSQVAAVSTFPWGRLIAADVSWRRPCVSAVHKQRGENHFDIFPGTNTLFTPSAASQWGQNVQRVLIYIKSHYVNWINRL